MILAKLLIFALTAGRPAGMLANRPSQRNEEKIQARLRAWIFSESVPSESNFFIKIIKI